MATLSTDESTQIYYEERGDGNPSILLIHGVTSSHFAFDREFAWMNKEHLVIRYDLRGHGESSKPENYTLDDHIHDGIELITQLGLRNVILLGESLGSYVAQGIATRRPDLLSKLILVVPTAHGEGSSFGNLQREHAHELVGKTSEEAFRILSSYVIHTPSRVDPIVAQTLQYDHLTPIQKKAATKSITRFDFRAELSKIKLPALVISGKFDILNPPGFGREVADLIPDAQFIEFENEGHMLRLENPERFKEVTSNFLNES
ncbi:alpha/beta hydrolase [Sporolactobacillus shoreicorticis]|uniref:Alpha/beta fold hydrolase n=1 Tax=Sporolactobacillus shoreicorticis TaxID=1923877 RepID=A0ABW5S100_9BACL|nr:alpha/beta hydrolase [Sporolactobacillus shoreicorticis]MCO7125319.1 alpha/beta hydrolase [Sporolactobacillus shoreicorticis]